MRALLVHPAGPDSFFGLRHLMKVVHARASHPPLGLLTVGALLPPDWAVRLVDMQADALTDDAIAWADLVFVSAMLADEPCACEVIRRCRALGRRVVAGGPLFTQEPHRFDAPDHLVLDEAEATLPRFLEDLAAGSPGRVYRADARADMSRSPIPRWDLIDPARYVSMSLQISRGCPFDCEFCNVISLLGRQWRAKPAIRVVAELDRLYATGWRGLVMVVDDNFVGDRSHARAILEAIADWQQAHRYPFSLSTQAPIHLAADTETLRLMGRAGFNVVEVGFESTERDSLVEAGKRQSLGIDPLDAVRMLYRHGLAVVGTFIAGFDHDPPDVFDRQLEFIDRAAIPMAKLWLLQAFPGSRLHDRVSREGRLRRQPIAEGTMNFEPRLDAGSLERGYRDALRRLYEPRAFEGRMRRFLTEYRPQVATAPTPRQVAIALRSVLYQGVLDSPSRAASYWRLLRYVARHNRAAWKDAFVPIIFTYHAHRWLRARWPGTPALDATSSGSGPAHDGNREEVGA